MNKRNLTLCALTATLGLSVTATTIFIDKTKNNFIHSSAETPTYKMVIDATNFASLSSTPTRVSGFALGSETSGFWKVQVNVVNGCKTADNKLNLGRLGKFLNFGPQSSNCFSAIRNISSIKVDFSGDLSLQYSSRKDGLELSSKTSLTSNVANVNTNSGVDYFCLTTNNGALIDKIEIEYSCLDDDYSAIDYLDNTTWTSRSARGNTYKLVCNNGNFTLDSMNMEVAEHYAGTYEKVDDLIYATFPYEIDEAITCEVTYCFEESMNHSTLYFDSKSDTFDDLVASEMDALTFNRVYNVEDFESYSDSGTGYNADSPEHMRSGLSGNYFYDIEGEGTPSPVGTTGYSLGTYSDNLNLNPMMSHSGTKSGGFKVKQSKWTRYWQFDQLVGEPYIIGNGVYLSMWVKNPNFTDVQMTWGSMDTYAPLDNTTRTYGDFDTITIPANSDWKEYIVRISGTSYGYYVALKGVTADAEICIDDVTIYHESPYGSYKDPNLQTFASYGSLNTSAFVKQNMHIDEIKYFISLGRNGETKMYFFGQLVTVDNYSVDEEGNVTLDTTFQYDIEDWGALTLTKITGKFNSSGTAIENVALTGNLISSALESSTGITFSQIANTIDFETDNDSSLQSTYTRWYDSGSGWVEDTVNADRLKISGEADVHGTKAMKVRGYSKFRLTLATDFPSAKHINGMGLWMKNLGIKTYTLKWFYYRGTNLTDSYNPGSVCVPADGEWHYYQCGANVDAYNFALYLEASGATSTDTVVIDYVHIY